jgi:hypothetical protein
MEIWHGKFFKRYLLYIVQREFWIRNVFRYFIR